MSLWIRGDPEQSLQIADAMIAATALQHKLPLATGNDKHFKAVKELKLEVFSPA